MFSTVFGVLGGQKFDCKVHFFVLNKNYGVLATFCRFFKLDSKNLLETNQFAGKAVLTTQLRYLSHSGSKKINKFDQFQNLTNFCFLNFFLKFDLKFEKMFPDDFESHQRLLQG